MWLFIFIGVTFAVVPRCPDGWKSFEGATKCYKCVTGGEGSVMDVYESCIHAGGMPVSIHSAFEKQFVSGLGDGGWIGLTWSQQYGYTNYDGSPVDYMAVWSPAPPTVPCIVSLYDGQYRAQAFTSPSYVVRTFCQRSLRDSSGCPHGFIRGPIDALANSCYYVGGSTNWNDADAQCKSLGATLSNIVNQEENYFVQGLGTGNSNLPDDQQLWLGGVVNAIGIWVWNDGTQMNYTNWGSTNGRTSLSSACLAMRTTPALSTSSAQLGQWLPYDCAKTQRRFVCKTSVKL